MRPQTVDYSFWAWAVSIGLAVLGGLVALVLGGALLDRVIDDTMRSAPAGIQREDVEAGAVMVYYGTIVVGLLFSALLAYFAIMMRAGRNWARITLTVLGGISLLLGLPSVARNFNLGALMGVFAVISLLLTAAALILHWLPPSNRYFAEHTAARRAPGY